MTFEQINSKAAKLDWSRGTGKNIHNILDSARINADDTVYTNKSTTESEWDAVACNSLELLLGECKDIRLLNWFRRIGFVW